MRERCHTCWNLEQCCTCPVIDLRDDDDGWSETCGTESWFDDDVDSRVRDFLSSKIREAEDDLRNRVGYGLYSDLRPGEVIQARVNREYANLLPGANLEERFYAQHLQN